MAEITNLKEKAFKGVFWSYINKFGTQIIAIIPGMILARLISPEEYGVVAMAAVFSGLAYVLVDGGFGTALFQKKDADHLDCCTVFYFNIGICSFIYTIFFFLAPYCAAFFKMPEVTGIMRISLLGLITNAFGSIHGLLFRKRLEFKKPAIRNITVQIISATVAIIMALTDFGYWALVIQGLLQTTCGSIANWLMCEWRPTLSFSWERLRSMFGFGSKMFATLLIDYGFSKGYDVTIGKFYSASNLSFYNRAFTTANLFIESILGVMNSVSFPAFIQIQDDKVRTRYNTQRFIRIVCLLIFTLLFTILALAEPFFHFMYSSKWDEVIPLFQIVCLWGLFRPIKVILEIVILSNGKSSVYLLNSILNKVLVVLIILLSWNIGIKYMIVGQIVTIIAEILLFSYYTGKIINYNLFSIIKEVLPYLFISIAIGTTVLLTDYELNNYIFQCINSEMLNSIFRLIIGLTFSLILFVILNKKIKTKGYYDLLDLLETALKNRQQLSHLIEFLK